MKTVYVITEKQRRGKTARPLGWLPKRKDADTVVRMLREDRPEMTYKVVPLCRCVLEVDLTEDKA